MSRDLCTSYSFSFQLKTCQDIQYYRKTTPKNILKINVENFIIDFIKQHSMNNKKTDEALTIPKGRPKVDKVIINNNKYVSFPFSLKKSTITKIRKYKKLVNSSNFDKHVEKYIKQLVPSRNIEE